MSSPSTLESHADVDTTTSLRPPKSASFDHTTSLPPPKSTSRRCSRLEWKLFLLYFVCPLFYFSAAFVTMYLLFDTEQSSAANLKFIEKETRKVAKDVTTRALAEVAMFGDVFGDAVRRDVLRTPVTTPATLPAGFDPSDDPFLAEFLASAHHGAYPLSSALAVDDTSSGSGASSTTGWLVGAQWRENCVAAGKYPYGNVLNCANGTVSKLPAADSAQQFSANLALAGPSETEGWVFWRRPSGQGPEWELFHVQRCRPGVLCAVGFDAEAVMGNALDRGLHLTTQRVAEGSRLIATDKDSIRAAWRKPGEDSEELIPRGIAFFDASRATDPIVAQIFHVTSESLPALSSVVQVGGKKQDGEMKFSCSGDKSGIWKVTCFGLVDKKTDKRLFEAAGSSTAGSRRPEFGLAMVMGKRPVPASLKVEVALWWVLGAALIFIAYRVKLGTPDLDILSALVIIITLILILLLIRDFSYYESAERTLIKQASETTSADISDGLKTEMEIVPLVTTMAAEDAAKAVQAGRAPLLAASETVAFEFLFLLLGAQLRRGTMQGIEVRSDAYFIGTKEGRFYSLKTKQGGTKFEGSSISDPSTQIRNYHYLKAVAGTAAPGSSSSSSAAPAFWIPRDARFPGLNTTGPRPSKSKTYDPTARPWYKDAIAARPRFSPICTPVYAFTSGGLGVTIAQELEDGSGVVAVDFNLEGMSSWLRELVLLHDGGIAVVTETLASAISSTEKLPLLLDDTSLLVGTSTGESTSVFSQTQLKLVQKKLSEATAADSPALAKLWADLSHKYQSARRLMANNKPKRIGEQAALTSGTGGAKGSSSSTTAGSLADDGDIGTPRAEAVGFGFNRRVAEYERVKTKAGIDWTLYFAAEQKEVIENTQHSKSTMLVYGVIIAMVAAWAVLLTIGQFASIFDEFVEQQLTEKRERQDQREAKMVQLARTMAGRLSEDRLLPMAHELLDWTHRPRPQVTETWAVTLSREERRDSWTRQDRLRIWLYTVALGKPQSIYAMAIKIIAYLHVFVGLWQVPASKSGDSLEIKIIDGLCTMALLLDFGLRWFVASINGIKHLDAPRTRFAQAELQTWGSLYRLGWALLLLIEFALRAAGFTGMVYTVPLRVASIPLVSQSIARTISNFMATVWAARTILIFALQALVIFVTMSILTTQEIFHNTAFNNQAGRGFRNFEDGLITGFVYIFSGANYPDLVYPATQELTKAERMNRTTYLANAVAKSDEAFYTVFFIIWCLLGMFVIISLLLAEFQMTYGALVDEEERKLKHDRRLGHFLTFALLADRDVMSPRVEGSTASTDEAIKEEMGKEGAAAEGGNDEEEGKGTEDPKATRRGSLMTVNAKKIHMTVAEFRVLFGKLAALQAAQELESDLHLFRPAQSAPRPPQGNGNENTSFTVRRSTSTSHRGKQLEAVLDLADEATGDDDLLDAQEFHELMERVWHDDPTLNKASNTAAWKLQLISIANMLTSICGPCIYKSTGGRTRRGASVLPEQRPQGGTSGDNASDTRPPSSAEAARSGGRGGGCGAWYNQSPGILRVRRGLSSGIHGNAFRTCRLFIVVLNVLLILLLGTQTLGKLGSEQAFLAKGYILAVFLAIWLLEVALHLFAVGWSNFWRGRTFSGRHPKWQMETNYFDAILVSVSVFMAFWYLAAARDESRWLHAPVEIAVCMPCLRVLSVIQGTRHLIFGLVVLLPRNQIPELFITLLMVFYLFGTFLVIDLAGEYTRLTDQEDYALLIRANFDNTWYAFKTLFNIMMGEAWTDFLFATVDARGRLEEVFFLILFFLICAVLFVNLFIGIICDVYSVNIGLLEQMNEDGEEGNEDHEGEPDANDDQDAGSGQDGTKEEETVTIAAIAATTGAASTERGGTCSSGQGDAGGADSIVRAGAQPVQEPAQSDAGAVPSDMAQLRKQIASLKHTNATLKQELGDLKRASAQKGVGRFGRDFGDDSGDDEGREGSAARRRRRGTQRVARHGGHSGSGSAARASGGGGGGSGGGGRGRRIQKSEGGSRSNRHHERQVRQAERVRQDVHRQQRQRKHGKEL